MRSVHCRPWWCGAVVEAFQLLLAAALLSGAVTRIEAATELILVGKHQAHATRILAKHGRNTHPQATSVTLQSLGLAVRGQSQLVPGLVVLDSADTRLARQNAGADPGEQAAALIERIRALEESGLFEYVQPSYLYTNLLVPNDARFTDNTLWGLRNTGAVGGKSGADIGAVQAWDLTTGSSEVIVAVIDTGIRYSHQEFAGQMWRNPGEIPGDGLDNDGNGVVDDVYGLNAVTGSGDPFDDNDHGTHLAGIIGAGANDGFPHVGVAWQVRLMACKFLAIDGFGTSDDAIRCIDYAVRHGAKVINASWAGAPFERALFDAISAARRAGVLFVAAAGNDFNDNDAHPIYPAAYRLDNVITVAAMDRQDRLTSFSNFGRSSVHLAAPGRDIFSCAAGSDRAYGTLSGTSMAAPYVSGVAALIFARFPNASVPEVRERLLSTVVQVPALSARTSSGGRLNAYQALTAAPDGVLALGLEPAEGSDLSARRPVPFYVTVTDLVGVTNATVRVRFQDGQTEVLFRNDGAGVDFKALDEVYSEELTLPPVPGPFNLTFTVSAPGKTTLTRTVTYQVAAPPLNDDFADALEIPPAGTLLQWTNRFATIEAGEPKHAQVPSVAASVWWHWTPAQSGSVIVDTVGSSFDTVLAVYTNTVLNRLREVASIDDLLRKKQGYVTFDAKAGLVYHIAVAGFSAPDAGTIRLRVTPGGGPDLTPPQVVITGPASGLVVTNASDPKLLVTGTASDPGPDSSGLRQVQVQVNRDLATTAIGTTNWSSTVLLQEGQNRIKIIATDYAGNASPLRSIQVTYDPLISPNDFLANAHELTGPSGTVSGNNTRATQEPGEPAHAGRSGGKSIWWVYRPATDGVLSLSTANSGFDTLLALYTGTARIDRLHWLASNDEAFPGAGFSQISQPLKGGADYWIAVDGLNGSSGLVQLDYTFRPATVYRLIVRSSPGGSAAPASAFAEGNSTLLVTAIPDPFFWFDHWAGSLNTTENPLSIVVRQDIDLTPEFRPLEFLDDFESGGLSKLPWTTTGAAPWSVQTGVVQSGRFAARSGLIGSGQRSSLLLTGSFRAAEGSFGVRVSSEATWDTLDFYLNGRRLNRWSGEIGWTEYQFSLPAGTSKLEWRYSKDFLNTSVGLDAAFIDNLDLPLFLPVDNASPARLAVQQLGNGAFQLSVQGQTNQLYLVQSSPDLNSWTTLSTNIARSGFFRWTDDPTPLGQRGFYRALVPP